MTQQVDASVIGDGLKIEGNIASEGNLQVDGHVQGDVSVKTLTVGPEGHVEGKITAHEIMVYGRVTGEMVARIATLGRTARVKGDLAHENLSIESGAEFEGRCIRSDLDIDAKQPKSLQTAVSQVDAD